ncbi:MAG: O-antigen ligase family protein [Dokdonella sp.]
MTHTTMPTTTFARAPAHHGQERPPGKRAETLLAWIVAIALLGNACLLDPWADAAFDAPKRLVALMAAAIGGVVLCMHARWPRWRDWSATARCSASLAVLGAFGLLLAASVSPHPTQSWSTVRSMLLFGAYLAIGASDIGARMRGRVACVIAAAVAVNICISLAQGVGVALPIPVVQMGGRFPTGALLGNEAYVTLAAAFAAAACTAFVLNTRRALHRWLALVLGASCIAVIVDNRQLTSAIALTAAVIAVVAIRMRQRWIVWFGASVLLIAIATVVIPPVRALTWSRVPGVDVETYQRLTTYRLAAWAAAEDMVRTRPLLGYGPGTYASEAQTHRLAAEMRVHERLRPPPNASAFVYAHQEYLQLAAEAGIPTALAFLGAFGVLLGGLLRKVRSPGPVEPLALFGILVAGAVSALAWFPLQIPFTAIVLLMAIGRAFRVVAIVHESDTTLPGVPNPD